MKKLTKLTAYLVAFILVISTVSFPVFAESSEDVLSVANMLTAEMLTTDNEPECSVTKNLNLDITEDITLPDGVTVTFKSSNEDIIANDGTVKRNSSVAKEVTLTATVSKSASDSVSKELKFTVLPLSNDVISSDSIYYPELKDKDIVACKDSVFVHENPQWSFSTLNKDLMENILIAKYSRGTDGTYNITATRKNLTGQTDAYVKYADPQIPDVIQTSKDNFVSLKINFNPVTFGSTAAQQLYLRVYGKAGNSERMITHIQFWGALTRFVDPKAAGTALVTDTKNKIKLNENNSLELKIDYNKSECYLYLNGVLINSEGVKLPEYAPPITRQIDSVNFGYLRSTTDSVLQINDITITRETPYKVASLSDISSEIVADGQSPEFIENSLKLPSNKDISWESSNTSVIANDGTVTRPILQDEVVTITATDGINTKALEFTVKAETVTSVAENSSFTEPFFGQVDKGDLSPLFTQSESAKTTFNYADREYFAQFNGTMGGESVFSSDTASFPLGSSGKYIFEFDAAYSNEGNAMFKFLADEKMAICMNNNGGDIKISNSADDEWNNTNNKTYATVTADEWNKYKVVINTLAETPCASIYMNGAPLAENVALLNYSFDKSIGFAICAKDSPTKVMLDNLVLYTESGSGDINSLPNSAKANFFAELITYSEVTDENYYDLQNDLDFETLFEGYDLSDLGVNVEWTTSQPQIISETGKVTRQENNRYVVITATITAGSGDDAAVVTKEFPFTVAAADSGIHASFVETYDDIELGNNMNWTAGADTVTAVTEIEGRIGKVLEMTFEKNPSFARKRLSDRGVLDKRYFISADVYFSPDSVATKQYVELLGPGPTLRAGFDFAKKTVSMQSADGDIFYAVPFTDIKTDTWYHIDIDFNAARKNFMIYINGHALAAEYVDLSDATWAARQYLGSFGVYSYGTGKAYIDNLVMRSSNSAALPYDETRDYTVRSVGLTNAAGSTISNPAHDAESIVAKVKVIKNREIQNGETKVFFARYNKDGKLMQIVSQPINTQVPGYETNGQILKLEMPLTGDCSTDKFKIFVISGVLAPYTFSFDSLSTIFDTEKLFNKPANVVSAEEVGYYPTGGYENIDAIFFDGDTYKGRPVKHFAYIGIPEGASAENPVPAVVCVHGGQDSAQQEWVKRWNNRGYAAIAIDHNGRFPSPYATVSYYPRHAWAGGSQDNYGGVSPYDSGWMYGAVTATIGAHNVLREMPEIDNSKIGITGISWGGVITSTVIGIDNRFAFAIPCFGCGYLYDSETWMADYMTEEKLRWEPSNFIGNAEMPILWMNGDKDTAFAITSTSKSSLRGGENSYTAIIPGYNHGNASTWSRTEPYDFADSIVKGGTKFIRGTAVQNASTVTATTDRPAVKATLRYMTVDELYFDAGTTATYDVLTVTTTDANTDTFTFTLPSDATMFYVTFTDENGNNTSTVLYDVK